MPPPPVLAAHRHQLLSSRRQVISDSMSCIFKQEGGPFSPKEHLRGPQSNAVRSKSQRTMHRFFRSLVSRNLGCMHLGVQRKEGRKEGRLGTSLGGTAIFPLVALLLQYRCRNMLMRAVLDVPPYASCARLHTSRTQSTIPPVPFPHPEPPALAAAPVVSPTTAGGSIVVFVDKISGADILLEQFGGAPLAVRGEDGVAAFWVRAHARIEELRPSRGFDNNAPLHKIVQGRNEL